MTEKQGCLCTKVCDCQNPPPDGEEDAEGCFAVSEMCPVHNAFPLPYEECPVHGKMSEIEFAIAKDNEDSYADID
jgi:hypothetical protein